MFNVLKDLFFTAKVPARKVVEIDSETLGTLHVYARDESMVLFGPSTSDDKYQVVLQRPTSDSSKTSLSLFRTNEFNVAEDVFHIFAHRVPIFIGIVDKYFNVNGLQQVCDVIWDNPSWNLAHLVTYFNLPQKITHPKVQPLINQTESTNEMSPFQLAIKCGHVDMVRAMVQVSDVEHLDLESNSVYHYAATTSEEIINILCKVSVKRLNDFNLDGYTPLHLACLSDKPECVNALLLAGADVNLNAVSKSMYQTSAPASVSSILSNKKGPVNLSSEDMKHGGTPLHWCSSHKSLVALISAGCDVNAKNFDGRTALHVMASRERLQCVISLLAHDAEVDMQDKNGDTALHIAVRKGCIPIIQCLIVFQCDIDKLNNEGHSARHLAGSCEKKDKRSEILYILHSVGARRCIENSNCNDGCDINGTFDGICPESPEAVDQRSHIEDMLASTSIENLADIITNAPKEHPVIVDTAKEIKGQSIMDAVLGIFSKSKPKESEKTTPESISNSNSRIESPNSESPADDEPKEGAGFKGSIPYGRGRVLCLDGGGIRGLVLVQMLYEIEKLAKTPIIHLFDWIAGTSTGGILALGLCSGKTMRQCMSLYLKMKEECFIGSRPYPSDKFEEVLKDVFGEETVMTDIKHPKVMIAGLMADRKPVDLHLFRNYKCASEILGIDTPISNRREPPPQPQAQLIWRAARATGAAPTYFRSFGSFLDGGLIANNPTLDAMTEIHEYNMALRSVGLQEQAIPISVVVSLGTGLVPVTEIQSVDFYRPENIVQTVKMASILTTMLNLIVDQATSSDGRVVDRARAWCSTIGVPYFRFNPQLSEDILMDEKDDQKLINMLWCTQAYMRKNQAKIMKMLNILKNNT